MSAFNAYCRAHQLAFRALARFLDWSQPRVFTGAGSIKKLPAFIHDKGLERVLVVTDKELMRLRLLDSLLEGLKNAGVEYFVYDETRPNPTIGNAEEARRLFVENRCDSVIAFGGGSPMDCAKIAAARAVNPKKTVPQMRGQLKVGKKLPPLFAVPTTAGTGSETTVAAVITDPETHEKYAVNDPKLRPGYAVLDPELTTGLPGSVTATTGMDALTHAVEAYIGRSNTSDTRYNAEKAVKMIFENLEKAYNNGSDIEARNNMLHAAHYAGIAFTRAYVGYVHAIAHNLGGIYGIAHGLANAVILPYVLDAFGSSVYVSLAGLADAAGLGNDAMTSEKKAKAFIAEIREMNRRMNIPDALPQIKEEDIPLIAGRAEKEANPLYPVPKILNKDELASIIKKIKEGDQQ